MKKLFTLFGSLVLVAAGAGFLFRAELWAAAQELITKDMYVSADTDNFDPGLPVGAKFPPVRAIHDGSKINNIEPLIGAKGMVFIANRSADWCPYCMAQFVQLQQHLESFRDAGIAVVALTYDSPQLQREFIEKNAIAYPFLSDIDAATVQALGILNEEYEPGDRAYGIPHPGIFVVDLDSEIVGKIFVDGYEKRVDAASVLAYARNVLGL